MKKFFMFFTLCAIFLIVSCGGSKDNETPDSDELQNDEDIVDIDDPNNPTNPTDDPTNPTDDPTNPTDEPTNPTDDPTNPTDDPTNPTDDPTDPTDDPTNPTDDPTNPTDDPTNPTDDPTNPTDDPTNPTDDPTNPTDDPTNPTDDPTNPTDDPTNPTDDPTNPTEPEIVCTGISLDASTFMPYYENVYIGFVENGILGDASSDDIIEVDFRQGTAVGSYAASVDYSCTACTYVTQDYGTEGEKVYFQKNGIVDVSEYDPETMEMSAEISATLVAVTIDNGYFTPDETDCITIETGIVRAEETSDHAIKTCAGITECKKGCNDEDETCIENCFNDISAVARTQYLNLFSTCNDEHNCENNYYCLWENCVAEEEICGMRGDTENYNIPYGEVTINGTFTYLHAEGETEILYSHALEAAFVTGTFGNNNTPVVDSTGQLLSYAKIAPFKDVPEEKNITLVQTYKKVEGKSFGPTVHIVTTLREPGAYKLGLSDWEEEARLFISDTDSEGEKICDHAFGVGTINITAISWTPGETTISVNGTATLYSYKASPHYGGDISGTEWVACDPK